MFRNIIKYSLSLKVGDFSGMQKSLHSRIFRYVFKGGFEDQLGLWSW